jgi:hypothetical protein
MPIISDRLGGSPLHRTRNRIASEILESRWIVNYAVNKKYLDLKRCVPLRNLTCYDDRAVAVIIGAGPSLARNLEDLVKYAPLDRCHVFCTDKAFPMVSKILKPAYVTALNAQSPDDEVSGWWKSGDSKESTLIMPITADPITLDVWNGNYCLVNCALPLDLTDTIAKETGLNAIPGGTNVGVFSYLMASRMGYKTLMLLGMDYSFASREQVVRKYAPNEPYIIFEHRDFKGEVRWASWDWFDSAISFFEYARFLSRNGIRTINSTEGGIVYDGEYIEAWSIKEAKL